MLTVKEQIIPIEEKTSPKEEIITITEEEIAFEEEVITCLKGGITHTKEEIIPVEEKITSAEEVIIFIFFAMKCIGRNTKKAVKTLINKVEIFYYLDF